jgi:predicted transcriptional regulator
MNKKLSKIEIQEIHNAVKNTSIGNSKEINIYHVDKKRIPLPANIMVFQAFAYLAATKLKDCSNRVLMLLFSKSGYENFVSMDVTTIAEELNYTNRSVISALEELTKHNIIIKTQHPSDKRRNDYFINPMSAWKGNSFARKKMIESIDTNQLNLFNIPTPGVLKQIKENVDFDTET